MSEAEKANEIMLENARNFVQHLEQGDQESADKLLSKIANLRESELFQELGKLTREFHEALNSFRGDEKIAILAEDDIPDAKQRLNYVIERTEDAANRTLTAVEECMPACDQLSEKSQQLEEEWHKFVNREMSPQGFRELSKDISSFFTLSKTETDKIKSQLNDVLMAQDFQDITGQIIRKVITLVEEVEQNLVNLIRLGGGQHSSVRGEKKRHDDSGELAGPQIPGMESNDIVSSQDDVDDLLSSLGF